MKTNPRLGRAAFTLIELMAVITIIVILAGLVVGGMGFVNERQAKEKAKVQIALISKALEEFKLENGAYPPLKKNNTDGTLESDNNVDPISKSNAITQSKALYKALFWDTDFDGSGAVKSTGERDDADQKIYLPELNPGTTSSPNKQGWISGTGADAYIIDPWGNPFAFRSALDAPTGTAGNKTPVANSKCQNPDFDLWSFGKDATTKPDTPSDKANRDDIKNF